MLLYGLLLDFKSIIILDRKKRPKLALLYENYDIDKVAEDLIQINFIGSLSNINGNSVKVKKGDEHNCL